MKKVKLAATAAATAALAAVLLPAPAASAAQVPCGDPNFVKVIYHSDSIAGPPRYACFAGAGWNSFTGVTGSTSWMDHIHTGNNDAAFRDCNGALVEVRRGSDIRFGTARCIRDIGIKPF